MKPTREKKLTTKKRKRLERELNPKPKPVRDKTKYDKNEERNRLRALAAKEAAEAAAKLKAGQVDNTGLRSPKKRARDQNNDGQPEPKKKKENNAIENGHLDNSVELNKPASTDKQVLNTIDMKKNNGKPNRKIDYALKAKEKEEKRELKYAKRDKRRKERAERRKEKNEMKRGVKTGRKSPRGIVKAAEQLAVDVQKKEQSSEEESSDESASESADESAEESAAELSEEEEPVDDLPKEEVLLKKEMPVGDIQKKEKQAIAVKSNQWVYTEHPSLQSTSVDDVANYYKRHVMTIEGHNGVCYKPIMEFKQAGFPEELVSICGGFKTPTPIQSASWPIVLKNKDIIAIAETGSGKTLGFMLPALIHVCNIKANQFTKQKPTVLILLPTRELAMQVEQVASEAGALCGVKSLCVYGGVPKHDQTRLLRQGLDIIVATPGRLIDLIGDGVCDLSHVSYLVLDEADRMLDLGFEQNIRDIISNIPKEHQTLMFSATWPTSVRTLSSEFLRNPIRITIGDEELAASPNVTQIVEVVEQFDKERKLIKLLQKYHDVKNCKNRILVFALYKKEAERIENMLHRSGYKVVGIHGDKNQASRTAAIAQFKDGSLPILVATDVAARGLDIPHVEYVINLTFPLTIEDYVHRIGRTGRAGNKGISHTLFTAADKAHSGALINMLKQSNQEVPESLMKFGTTVKRKEHKAYGKFFKDVDENVKATKITFDSDDE